MMPSFTVTTRRRLTPQGTSLSFLQAVTQIQEQTLTFVPKMLVAGLSLFFLLPFIGDALSGYMARLASRIAFGG